MIADDPLTAESQAAETGARALDGLLGRPPPAAFARWTVTIRPGRPIRYQPGDWRDALVIVTQGKIECEGRGGSRTRFASGAVLALADLPLIALHSGGRDAAVLVVIRRRATGGAGRSSTPGNAASACSHTLTASPDRRVPMHHATSRDGTTVASDATGDGPPIALVDGAFGSRTFGPNGPDWHTSLSPERKQTMTTGRSTIARPRQERSGPPGGTRRYRDLLTCGAVAGPLYIAIGAVEVLTRDGFDIRHHELSLAANGHLGWVQTMNFLISGLLTIAGAVGLHRGLRAGPAATWGPRLVAVYGLGVLAAGLFRADPADGFPVGTPAGRPAHVSWHGNLHFIGAGIGFLALVAACFVVARRFSVMGMVGWATYSRLTGALFLLAFAGVASGSNNPPINLGFTAAVILGWVWTCAIALHFRSRAVDA